MTSTRALTSSADLIGLGLVASQARPDGNTTGVNIFAIELDGKRQEILIEAVPGLRRMAFLADANFETAATLEALQEAARARNIDLSIHRIAKGEEITAAIDAAKASGAEGLNFSASPLFFTYRQLIIDRVAALRLPAIYEWPETAEEGGLAAYGPRLSRLFVEVMTQQLVKLFHGIKVADIPVEQPAKFELVINLKTANALGLTVSQHYWRELTR
jgi:putative ABC transport system substrate-binding protein